MKGYIFAHGWGSSSEVWGPLLEHMPSCPLIFLERGYFRADIPHTSHLENARKKDIQAEDIRWIGIGHSLGFVHLLMSQLPFAAVVGVQAFVNFLGSAHSLHRLRAIHLRNLIQQFEQEPEQTLALFQARSGLPSHTASMNVRRLSEDLRLLSHDYSTLLQKHSCLVIGSADDHVVTKTLLYDNFSHLHNVQVELFTGGRHNIMKETGKALWDRIQKICPV